MKQPLVLMSNPGMTQEEAIRIFREHMDERYGLVGELADPPVSKAGAARRPGSNPGEATFGVAGRNSR